MRFNKPSIYRKDMDSVLQTMVEEEIGPGERKKEYEKCYRELIKRDYAFSFRTYYDTLYYALKSLNLEDGSEVGISVLSPRIYLDAIKRASLKAVILDIDDKMLLSVKDASKNLRDLKALLYFEPCSQIPRTHDEIKSLGLKIIEDISESAGSYWEEGDTPRVSAGDLGDIVISRSEEDSIISTGGGGIFLTSDEIIVDRFSSSIFDLKKFIGLSDLNASLGIVQIGKLDMIQKRREVIFRRYLSSVLKSNAKVFGSSSIDFHPSASLFQVIVESKPEEIIEFAKKYQVVSKRSYTSSVGERYKEDYERFPQAMAVLNRSLSFPIYPFLKEGELDALDKVLSHLH